MESNSVWRCTRIERVLNELAISAGDAGIPESRTSGVGDIGCDWAAESRGLRDEETPAGNKGQSYYTIPPERSKSHWSS